MVVSNLQPERLHNRYTALYLAHVCACVTGLQHIQCATADSAIMMPCNRSHSLRFVETGNLRVIGLRDVMCHMTAVLERKAAGEVKRGYLITTSTVCMN